MNNATDQKANTITVRQFLRRAERVYAEGGSNAAVSNHYAHAQDNVREKNGGGEEANFTSMEHQNFDESSSFPSYKKWNTSRGTGYDDLDGLNDLDGADNAIKAVAGVLTGTTSDPTNGATQWRGDVSKNLDLRTKQMEQGKTDASIMKSYGVGSVYVKQSDIISTGAYIHIFFSTQKDKNVPQERVINQDDNCTDHSTRDDCGDD